MANPATQLLHGQTVLRDGDKGEFIFHGFARSADGYDQNTALVSRAGESKIETVPAGTLKAKPAASAPVVGTATEKAK